MATRRQREAAAPLQAANAGRRNQTAAAAVRSGPRNPTAAAPSGPRDQTASAAAAATCRPHARNRRALGDIGNQVNAPVVDGEANHHRVSRSLSARPSAAVADENTTAPAHPATAVECVRRAGRVASGKNKKLSKGDTTKVTSAEIVDSLVKAVVAKSDSMVQRYRGLVHQLTERCEEIMGEHLRLITKTKQLVSEKVQKEAEVQKLMEELEIEKAHNEAQVQKVMKLESEKAQKEAQVRKVMEENVRLGAMLDKKEAQLQAMSEQSKFMALMNHHN